MDNLHAVNVGDRDIRFTLHFSRRKTMVIQVYPNRSVVVRAPLRTSQKRVEGFVRERASWVHHQQEKFGQLPPPPAERRYVSGEQLPYLGDVLTLQVERGIANQVALNEEQRQLLVTVTRVSETRVKTLVEDWFKAQAKRLFHARLEDCLPRLAPLGITYDRSLRLRNMKSRWGSCTHEGNITLSYGLMEKPLNCIDYVIIHELCHLREMNHSPAFYVLMDQAMPDWQSYRRLLNGRGDKTREA